MGKYNNMGKYNKSSATFTYSELKENLAKMGADIKQKILDSFKSTWTSINNFARAHQSETLEQQVESEMSQVVQQLEDDDRSCKYRLE